MTYLKKIEGTWFLMSDGEIVESYESQADAELALFDANRRWTSLYDEERNGDCQGCGQTLMRNLLMQAKEQEMD